MVLPGGERRPWPPHEAVGVRGLLKRYGGRRGSRAMPGLSHQPLQLRQSLVFLKDAPNNSKIFLKGGRELYIAFSHNK